MVPHWMVIVLNIFVGGSCLYFCFTAVKLYLVRSLEFENLLPILSPGLTAVFISAFSLWICTPQNLELCQMLLTAGTIFAIFSINAFKKGMQKVLMTPGYTFVGTGFRIHSVKREDCLRYCISALLQNEETLSRETVNAVFDAATGCREITENAAAELRQRDLKLVTRNPTGAGFPMMLIDAEFGQILIMAETPRWPHSWCRVALRIKVCPETEAFLAKPPADFSV